MNALKISGIGPDICEIILCALQEFTSQYGGEKHLVSMGVYWWVLAVLQGGEDRVTEYRLAKKKRQGHVSASEAGSERRGTVSLRNQGKSYLPPSLFSSSADCRPRTGDPEP